MKEERAMGKNLISSVVLAAALITMAWVGSAAAIVPVSVCGTLSDFGQTYNLTGDLHACGGDCLVVASNSITIDLKGHSIIQDCPSLFGAGITDRGIRRDVVIVRNGTIRNFVFGVELDSSSRTEVRKITAQDNDLDGILVGDTSLVKNCTAVFNGFGGILGGDGVRGNDRVQVERCETSGNGANGIRVGKKCLVTANVAEENLEDGIATGPVCTISLNTASGNDDDGIDAGRDGAVDGSRSLVTANRTEENFNDGIRVQCPSTVTINVSTGNGTNIDLVGRGCQKNGNQEN